MTDPGELRAKREGMLLRMLLRATRAMNDEVIGRIATSFDGVQPSYTRLLGNLDTEGTRIAVIARRMGTTRQAASQLVVEVEAKGFVRRADDPDDARGVVVKFTPRGRQMLERAVEVMIEVEGEYAARVGATDYARLKKLLARLVEEIDPRGALDDE